MYSTEVFKLFTFDILGDSVQIDESLFQDLEDLDLDTEDLDLDES